jgi:hypothetical protein
MYCIYRISLLLSRSILTSTEIDGKTYSETGKRPDYVALANEVRKSCDE